MTSFLSSAIKLASSWIGVFRQQRVVRVRLHARTDLALAVLG